MRISFDKSIVRNIIHQHLFFFPLYIVSEFHFPS